MNKSKKTIVITSLIVVIILITCTIFSIILNNYNKTYKNTDKVYICIYQYEVDNYNINYQSEKKLYDKIEFNMDTNYDEIITALDSKGTNHVIIKNGVVYVNESSCANHICMKNVIRYKNSIINNLVITCMPNGLVICLERS